MKSLSFLLAMSALTRASALNYSVHNHLASAPSNETTPSNVNSGAESECRCGMSQFLTLPHANITHPSQAKQCANYKLIDARGTAEPQGVSTMFYPMIENILANVTGGVSLPVEYPAAASQNTTSGERFVVDTIAHGLQHCPHQKYALFGYSQGATLVLKVLRQLSPSALESVKSVILVGNPYRLPGKISNVDATAQRDRRASVGMFAEEAIADNKTIPQLAKDMDRVVKCSIIALQ
ncbi:hypothetical protein CNMCM5623_005015 [Aspergillus felis]|uniref:Alpha/beta-hydrolase n=1 Tax=Aspergillus felis TaxID=1287682 RepID=A0A8H6UQG7_9EURO|nr:hypothetical protein CNMCM5623_005015 [Aspergillus felis]